MTTKKIFSLLVLVALFVLPANAAQKRALLIGVNDYKAEKVSDLNGAVNDIDRLQQVLRKRFDFKDQNIKTLRDSSATREAILRELRLIVREAEAEDTVYIHFSGHGSQVRDANGDEADDQLDETIVPHDGRMSGIADITDDELGAILGQLKTRNVLVVLDSCHSGTGTRGARLQKRSLLPDTRIELYAATTRDAMPQVVEVNDLEIVLMTGAANNQSALDGPIGDEYFGIFSYSLAKALDAGPRATPREIIEGVREEFLRIQSRWGGIELPDPQLEGTPERLGTALFPAVNSSVPTRTYLEVVPDAAGRVRLLGGKFFGASLNSLWGIYPDSDPGFYNGPLVTATVSERRDGDAVAVLSRAVDIPAGARAIEIQTEPVSASISVELRVPDALRTDLAAAMREAVGGLELVESGAFARFIVDVTDKQVALYAADGVSEHDRFTWSNAKSTAARLAPLLLRAHAGADLASLTNQSSAIDLSVRLVGSEPTRGVGVVQTQREGGYRIRKSDVPRTPNNSLMLEISSSHAVYLTIATVGADGSIAVLFPNTYQKSDFVPDGLIEANRVLRVPDSHSEDNDAGFHWDIVPPVGHDVIQVFASRDLQTASDIRRYVAELAAETGSRARGVMRGEGQSLHGLREALGRRGVGLVQSTQATPSEAPPVSAQAADWTVRAVRVEVRE